MLGFRRSSLEISDLLNKPFYEKAAAIIATSWESMITMLESDNKSVLDSGKLVASSAASTIVS